MESEETNNFTKASVFLVLFDHVQTSVNLLEDIFFFYNNKLQH